MVPKSELVCNDKTAATDEAETAHRNSKLGHYSFSIKPDFFMMGTARRYSLNSLDWLFLLPLNDQEVGR